MVQSPLTTRWESYFCMDALSRVFDLEYWDCSQVAYPAFFASTVLERPYTVTITSMEMLRDNLQRLPSDTLLLSDIHFINQNRAFHKLVGKYISNCIRLDMWCYSLGIMPLQHEQDIPISNRKSLKQILYQSDSIRLLVKFLRFHGDERFKREWQLVQQERSIRKEEKEVRDCERCYQHVLQITTKPHQTYSILHPDVEKYYQIRDLEASRKDRFVVYLDNYYPLHPDLDESEPELKHAQLALTFFQSINRFFAEVETQMDCKVVIAAHPVADYSNNPFEGREIIFGQTAELIRDSIAVCLIHTASANYIAMFDKPLVILECDATRKSKMLTGSICHLSNFVRIPIHDMDTECDRVAELFRSMDRKNRAYFIKSFIDESIQQSNEYTIPIHVNNIYKSLYSDRTQI